MLTLTPNFIREPARLVAMARTYADKFEVREGSAAHGSFLPVQSKFRTLKVHEVCPKEFIQGIFMDSEFTQETRKFWQFIQIQWYQPGDYIVPHQDAYSIIKLHLITLTQNPGDALIVQDGDKLVRVPDVAGQKVDMDYTAWHWVDPVVDHRYSLVIGV